MTLRWRSAVPALLCAAGLASAQPVRLPALDLNEQTLTLAVSATDLYGRRSSGTINVTAFRPPGDGPFPLAMVSHGRGTIERRAEQGRQVFEPLARYLVAKGFAVFVPVRLGYGDTFGQGDPEDPGPCSAPRPEPMATAAADQVLAAVELARAQPWVDASRWIAIGQSVGGLATTALAWRQPEGLVAAINFSGGVGGNPESRPDQPCSPQQLESLWASKAAAVRLPMLWIYWHNDHYWGPDWPQRWSQAWQRAGGALEFHQLDPVGSDGHQGLSIDMDHWVPLVEAYLARRGFERTGLPARPPASGYAAIDDVARLPASRAARDLYFTRFLSAPLPRAFAIGPGSVSGWASGDWALGRALGNCQRITGARCKLYAVDNEVVWLP